MNEESRYPPEQIEEVYDELHRIAARMFRSERVDHTLSPTAIVHEAYCRLAGSSKSKFEDEQHFVALAASTIRRVLVDHARSKRSQKRGGDYQKVTLASVPSRLFQEPIDLLVLDETLNRLNELNARHAKIAEMILFAGLSQSDVAKSLDLSDALISNEWRMARAWLSVELG